MNVNGNEDYVNVYLLCFCPTVEQVFMLQLSTFHTFKHRSNMKVDSIINCEIYTKQVETLVNYR